MLRAKARVRSVLTWQEMPGVFSARYEINYILNLLSCVNIRLLSLPHEISKVSLALTPPHTENTYKSYERALQRHVEFQFRLCGGVRVNKNDGLEFSDAVDSNDFLPSRTDSLQTLDARQSPKRQLKSLPTVSANTSNYII